jgi:DNA polymerase beta
MNPLSERQSMLPQEDMDPFSMDYKSLLIDALDTMRKKEVLEKQTFRARAYATVIRQLKERAEPVTCYEDIHHFQGVGEKIREKIKEIMETGQLRSAERVKETHATDAMDVLQHIYGVGPAKVRELIQMGIHTVEQLRVNLERNPLLLHEKQKIGLRYYEELLERIPREEMEAHRDILPTYLPAEMKDWETEIVGSFRRGLPTSGDIDMLIRVPANVTNKMAKTLLAAYVSRMKEAGYIEEILALGEHKCMAICRLGKARRLDLLLTPDEEYAYALLYFTGSDQFNVAFRHHALEKGYTLNEHRLTALHAELQVPSMKTEKDIFRFLGLRYIAPDQRVDKHQIMKRIKPRVAIQ